MDPEQNKAVIRQFFDAWNSRRPDEFDELIMPDVMLHWNGKPGIVHIVRKPS